MNHEAYSSLMPVVYTDKFNFYNAMEYTNRLKVVFKNDVGNYMSMSVFKDGDYNFYEQVLTTEEIKNIEADGYMNFAVKCGDYYIPNLVISNTKNFKLGKYGKMRLNYLKTQHNIYHYL